MVSNRAKCWLVATAHATVVAAAALLAQTWSEPAGMALTVALLVAPGVATLIAGRRQCWWRWPLLWALLLFVVPPVWLAVSLVGHGWLLTEAWAAEAGLGRGPSTVSSVPYRPNTHNKHHA